jgi:hypothetical protein
VHLKTGDENGNYFCLMFEPYARGVGVSCAAPIASLCLPPVVEAQFAIAFLPILGQNPPS